jgi:hypothetical protein
MFGGTAFDAGAGDVMGVPGKSVYVEKGSAGIDYIGVTPVYFTDK